MPAEHTPDPLSVKLAMLEHGITLRTLAKSAKVNYSNASLVLGGKRFYPEALRKLSAQLERLIAKGIAKKAKKCRK